MKKYFNNVNELIENSKEARDFYMGLDEKRMGNIMLNSSNIKSFEEMKKFVENNK